MRNFLSLGLTLLIMSMSTGLYAQGTQANCKKMEMVKVKGGVFAMGATAEQGSDLQNAEPVHVVTLSSFQIGKYEVTQKQWEELMGYNHSVVRRADLPVTGVSWNEIQIFIAKLNQLTGKHYRLPTEAEWEYAARGGMKTTSNQYSGSNNISEVACNKDKSNRAVACGSLKANELGIYDMSGNAMEWCHDRYVASYSFERLTDPEGPENGSERVLRGGSYLNGEKECRNSARSHDHPSADNADYGFRLVLSSHIISGYEAAKEDKPAKAEKEKKSSKSEAPQRETQVTTKSETKYTDKANTTYDLFTLNFSYDVTHGLPKKFDSDDFSIGFRYGQYKTVGMYFNLMLGTNFNGYKTKYDSNKFDYTSHTSKSRASITAGLMIKVCDPLALYAGAGLGYRSINTQTPDGKWHCMSPGSMLGCDVDMGLVLNLGGFALTLEAVTTNFKVWDAKIGIGVCLKKKKQ